MSAIDAPLLRARGIGKQFKLYRNPNDRLREWITRRTLHEEFWALRDVDVTLNRGECLGVIGANGSGKSTLLKILSGSLIPTEGEVEQNGRVLALIELTAGFEPRLTGRQNIDYVGQMFGFDESFLQERTPQILEFAELGEYIDQPTRTYSSGMFARLSFSMYAFLEPDLLMVDEVLAVGDARFRRKCMDHIEHLVREESRATIYVSHGMPNVARLATQVMWLNRGKVRAYGEPMEVINEYLKEFGERPITRPSARLGGSAVPETPTRSAEPQPLPDSHLILDVRREAPPAGTRARVIAAWLENRSGDSIAIGYAMCPATLSFAVEFIADVSQAVFSLAVFNDRGEEIDSCDTADPDAGQPDFNAGQVQIVRTPLRGLPPGRFTMTASCSDDSGELARTPSLMFTVIAFPGPTGLPHVLGVPRLDGPLEDVSGDGANPD